MLISGQTNRNDKRVFYVKKQRGTFNNTQMKSLLKIVWKPEMEYMLFGKPLKRYDKGNYASQKEIQEALI